MIETELMHRRNVMLFVLVSIFYLIQVTVNVFVGETGRVIAMVTHYFSLGMIPLLLIYIRVNPRITMYVMVSCIYLFFYSLLKDNPHLVNFLFMWLALPLSAIYQSYRLVMVGGTASLILTLYAFFFHRDAIFTNVETEDLTYFVMFGIFITIFLLTFIYKIREANDKLQQLAYRDPLTGAGNRLLLKEKFALLQKKKAQSMAILFIDMNGFKKVNDTYGHEVGDQLLEKLVSRLNDVLNDIDLLCRLGGDEFVILASNIDRSNVEGIMERARAALEKPILINQRTVNVSGSIGSSYTKEVAHADLETMIKEADQAMYKVKGGK
ncbi:GGDEF domain-containing protein [Bacillus sp. PS06]|uniref:GGDEF domain-containing protein n=1 Tax=Bacillus sp. PS06 TaxID=2764176 RepID=UPI00177B8E57|nr:GGDEF domain-containing protein [Bacillus sp. PS06]MBD8070175.1 GGDEF domain-containing protein [Bacillus sp. PS06]